MLDPFPFKPPAPLVRVVTPVANALSLPTLPLHAHEVLCVLALYTCVAKFFSPWISNKLVPKTYKNLNKRTRINWDVHVVSFVQSCIINALSLYVIFCDEERKLWRSAPASAIESGLEGGNGWEMRIWGYDGMSGLLQSFGLGYFLWDLYMCSRYVHIFGWGMLAHAVSAVTVFSFGFRPFLYYYAPVFLLYELSSPFLNIHWFCDKLDLTGSVYQAVNGAFLTTTFFLCRLCWGTYSSITVFRDVSTAVMQGYTTPQYFMDANKVGLHAGDLDDVHGQTTAFMDVRHVPLWLAASYLTSNIVLNSLNFWWFSKMIETIRKRFPPPFGTMKAEPASKSDALHADGKGSVKAAREIAERAMNGDPVIQRGIDADGHRSVEVSGSASTRRTTRRRG